MKPRAFSITGIVIRTASLAENDRFVTVLTPDHGKLTAIAKGIRSIKSRRNPHIELLNRIRLHLWKSNHHYYLTQCTTEERFSELKREMAGLASGAFLAELTEKLIPEEENHSEIFDLLNGTLALMDFYPERHALLREAYLVKLLKSLGFIGSFRACSLCHKTLPYADAFLNREQSTLHCAPCSGSPSKPNLESISLSTLKLMHFILERPIQAVLNIKMEENHFNTISEFGRTFLYKNLHHPLKSESALMIYK